MAKLAFAVFLVIGLIGACVCDYGDHNYYNCPDPSRATTKLCDVTFRESGKPSTTLVKDIECPADGVNKSPITCIIVTDLDSDADSGYAVVESAGGLGYYEAVIELTSQIGKGLYFRVQVYTNEEGSKATSTSTSPSANTAT